MAAGMAKVFGPHNVVVCAVMPSRSREESATDPGVDEYNYFTQKFLGVGFCALRLAQEILEHQEKGGTLLTRDSHIGYRFFFSASDIREAFNENAWLQSPGLSAGRVMSACAAADGDLVQVTWSSFF